MLKSRSVNNRQKTALLLFSFFILGACSHTHKELARESSRTPSSETFTEENGYLLSWLDDKVQWATSRLAQRNTGELPDYIDYYVVPKEVPLKADDLETAVAKQTKELYDEYFPKNDPSSYLGTFFECGHPWDKTSDPQGYQWNSLKLSGMEDPAQFDQMIAQAVSAPYNFKSIRIAPNLTEVGLTDQSWDIFLSQIESIWKHGATPIISVAFFPGLKKWEKLSEGAVNYSDSYLLNPKWPSDMGQLTNKMVSLLEKRAAQAHVRGKFVINPVNEPETLAGFNRQFWHGAYANWASAESMRYYVPSIINIAKANVEIRLAAERTSHQRLLFMHNEAMTPFYYPSHHGYGRFAVSKLMLGDDVLMKKDFSSFQRENLSSMRARLQDEINRKTIDEVDWSFYEYVFGSWNHTIASQNLARRDLVRRFTELQKLHQTLQASTGKSMKTDNILQLDYYYQTEFVPNIPVDQVIQELSANQGEKLKEALGFNTDPSTDRFFLNTLKNTANQIGGGLIPFNFTDRSQIDFQNLLTEEDAIMFDRLIGMLKKYDLNQDPTFIARQAKVGLPLQDGSSLMDTTDILTQLTANDSAKLIDLLQAKDEADLRAELSTIGKGDVTIPSNSSIRDILNLNQRLILNRVLGLTRNYTLDFQPQVYPRQMRAGIRTGFYQMFMQYVNALKMQIAGVGESGTPYYVFAPLLHDQMMMEYVTALKSGIYSTQYDLGPVVDTVGWVKAPLALDLTQDHEVSPSGLFPIPASTDQARQPWAPGFLNPIQQWIQKSAQ